MKCLVIISIGLLHLLNAQGQTATNTERSDETNIYFQSLKIYLDNLTGSDKTKPVVYVEKNHLLTDSLPKQIGSFKIEYLEGYEVMSKLKSINEMQLIHIIPVRIENGLFHVDIIPFAVRREKKTLRYENSGGDGIYFDFDCETKSLSFKEIRHGNI